MVQRVDEGGNAINGVTYAVYDAGENFGNIPEGMSLEAIGQAIRAANFGDTVTLGDGKIINRVQEVGGNQPVTSSLTKETDGIALDGALVMPGGHFDVQDQTSNYYILVEQSVEHATYANGGQAIVNGYADPVLFYVGQAGRGVYANAAEADDGVSVLRGVGALVESVTQFANHSLGDDTLAQIQAGLYVWKETDWAAADSANTGGGVSEGQNPMTCPTKEKVRRSNR